MKVIKFLVLPAFFVLLCLSCQRTNYGTKVEKCELTLNSDSTYSYAYPAVVNANTENGIYHLYKDSIVLVRKHYPKIPSIDLGYICSVDNPDTLVMNFTNLYKEKIQVEFSINNNEKRYKTNASGQMQIRYSDLEKQKVIASNEKIFEFKIFYKNKQYVMAMDDYKNSIKPNQLDFALNQFLGEEFAVLKRNYAIIHDTIIVNDISRKLLGANNRIVKHEETASKKVYK
ncbi:hypothetical protein ACFSX9_09495 [Flavobacterium ardleyense]|uniref:Lipoprotein n=1 Tax=Flavobacterium ardleyense TaxID=2038737 RepID=A0ABW5Z7W6_9FLAO